MVKEAEATGVVAGVYAGLLESMTFVPSLFKLLARCPGYLVLAHEQAAPVLPDPGFGPAAQQRVASVRNVATPPTDAVVREALTQFAGPLGRRSCWLSAPGSRWTASAGRSRGGATRSNSCSGAASSSASAVSVAATNRRDTADLLVEPAVFSTRCPIGSSPAR